ncbi:phytoene desaturase family protein [Egicoccus halophilus]|uniref:Dehydrosqualene desaturase n=1 Tax=Egicoccus halophilus TaxID=1670830 RepID=A0A8J3A6B4_9ACTN|nr:phytoene desaturase family protein [Egicoccus halophilus]GGI04467.1 dehydrosqualene desaturase [Egicoccus halophilus]
MTRALVLGAGIGGLSAAARLAHAGYQVQVHERLPRPGGRSNLIERGGFRIDTGPSILLMRDIVEGTFADVGADPADYVSIRRLDPAYRVFFADGTRMDAKVDRAELRAELEHIEPGAGARFDDFAEIGDQLYRGAREHFVERNFRSMREMFGVSNLPQFVSLRVYEPMHKLVGRHFRDPRLRQLFTFNAMYIGMNPFTAPAIYALLPYNDTVEGVHFADGGMYGVVEGLVRLCEDLGVEIVCDHPATGVLQRDGRAAGLSFADGDLEADLTLVNADWPWAQQRLLDREPRHPLPGKRLRYGPSAMNFYWAVQGDVGNLEAHNIMFGDDYEGNFRDVFAGKVHERPSYYVHVPTLADPSLAPDGHHIVYVLVPHSNSDAPIDWAHERDRVREFVLHDLEAKGVTLRERIQFEEVIDPPRWAEQFSLARGATFGLSHSVSQVGYLRPHNKDPHLRDLYYVGSSTHPGAGVPMVMLSARLVTERIVDEHPPARRGAPARA